MSIYPVPLQKWFPNPASHPGAVDFDYTILRMIVRTDKCARCKKFCKWNRAWGHHSLPFGYGDVFCGKRCACPWMFKRRGA